MRDSRTSDHPHDSAHVFNIEFQSDGIVMRFPPQFYALDWKDVANIEFANKQGSAGVLKLHMKYKSGSQIIEVGKVQQPCWDSVQKYLHDNLKR